MTSRILLTLAALSLVARADNTAIDLAGPVARELRGAGFITLGSSSEGLAVATVSNKHSEAQSRLRRFGSDRLLFALATNDLVSVPATSNHPDVVVTRGLDDNGQYAVVVSEFQTDAYVTPSKPVPVNAANAHAVVISWTTQLLSSACLPKGSNDVFEVVDKGEYLVAKRVLRDDDGKPRYMPWNMADSVRVVLSKNGQWGVIAVEDLSASASSMPAGRRMRFGGSWFWGTNAVPRSSRADL